MIVKFDNTFNKNLSKLVDSHLKLKVYAIIEEMIAAQKLTDITNIKKMKGYKTFYRIKLGDYRIGFELINNNTVYLIAFAHRKDIYKTFP